VAEKEMSKSESTTEIDENSNQLNQNYPSCFFLFKSNRLPNNF